MRKQSVYDLVVWGLLIWCAFQDIVLAWLLCVTNNEGIVKLLFYSKDVCMICLFCAAVFRIKIPKSFFCVLFAYFALIGVYIGIAFFLGSDEQDVVPMLSSARGLILLPVLTVVGAGVREKDCFLNNAKKYYRFLTVLALIGIVEMVLDLVVGTQSFWMEKLDLNNYYTAIKGQPALIENGTPGNWYTDIGRGYRTQKRLISIWAAPLAAGFVLLMPSLYYTMAFFSKRKLFSMKMNHNMGKLLRCMMICVVALALTFTRQTLLPFLLIAVCICLYYNKKNRNVFIACGVSFVLIVGVALANSIVSYLNNGSTMIHILRIKEALAKVEFFGGGIGSFGTRFSGAVATESQYITLVGQIGVIALPLYLYMLLYPILCCRKALPLCGRDSKIMICSICFSGLTFVLAGVVSETVAAFTSIAQYYILIGVAFGICQEYQKGMTRIEY